MEKGEAAFSTGRLNDALAAYQSALKLDPKLYHAALFSGDVYMQQGKYSEAEIWYQKAIAIDPNIETAYRYSATPLMKEGKTAEARDRYIEAFIVDPYNRLAVGGLVQWGEATQTPLSHPKIDVPEFKVGADGKANTTINVNPAADDGSVAWIGYSATRSEWYEKKFKQNYPNETAYRHSLKEEAEALRSVIAVVKETAAKTKTLNPQLAMLVKLDQEGFLESYILLAMPDKGIAQDHAAYLKQNRDRLRQYVAKYVIGGK
jgi:tetratricopeptide (TPR) repeat protein